MQSGDVNEMIMKGRRRCGRKGKRLTQMEDEGKKKSRWRKKSHLISECKNVFTKRFLLLTQFLLCVCVCVR